MNSYSETASFYRTALLLGLISGKSVIDWAERVIACDNDIPQALFELVMIPPGDITALRYALLEVCSETISLPVLKSILLLVFNDLHGNKRNIYDTMTVLHQIRYFIKTESSVSEKIIAFETEFEEAKHNGSMEPFQSKLYNWLKGFSTFDIVTL